MRLTEHPYISNLLDLREDEKHIYLVVEIALGGDLFDQLDLKGVYPEAKAKVVFARLCAAVKYLHSNGVIHRDLKPENILIASPTDDTDIRVTDFGVVKLFDSSLANTPKGGRGAGAGAKGTAPVVNKRMAALQQEDLRKKKTYTLCGTECYLAPEVLLGNGYDTQADMWSLGVILYLLLDEEPPFDFDNPVELYKQITQGIYTFPEEDWGHISLEAQDLVKKLLTVDAEKRMTAEQALQHPWLKDVALAKSKPGRGSVSEKRASINNSDYKDQLKAMEERMLKLKMRG
eukprot:TRINITY_DN10206_c0_g1_i1.p1 TRINITY_DN10206_c0_g1~~TRINITY_DN10206_c0_g1_i1.p1  ORF type:complete len:289 (-),score=95.86 TRINITY_DN10206_c0_g1_i1:122-988(-)